MMNMHNHRKYIRVRESPSLTDNLFCQRKIGNPHDTHAVAIKGSVTTGDNVAVITVGHIFPRRISAVCKYLYSVL